MGNDTALAVLSDCAPPLFSYFKQLFAQVTNPPIDPIRESIVMSLATGVGAESNLLDETPEHAHQLLMDQPILRNQELETLRHVERDIFRAHTIDITWPTSRGPDGMAARLANLCDEAHDAITAGRQRPDPLRPPHRPRPRCRSRRCWRSPRSTTTWSRLGNRLSAGLVLESGEPREIHHFATLIGYGVSAINPYLLFDTRRRARRRGPRGRRRVTRAKRRRNVVKAIGKGLLKTISKMGISTIQSYCGAQIFEAVGLERELVDRHFTGTASRIGGIGARRARPPRRSTRHARAWGTPAETTASCCRSAASTPGAATASTTCGTRRRSRSSSTPCASRAAPATRLQRRGPAATGAMPGRSTTSTRASSTRTPPGARRCAACCASATAWTRSRSTRSSPRAEIVQALRDRRDVARLDLDASRTRRSRSR